MKTSFLIIALLASSIATASSKKSATTISIKRSRGEKQSVDDAKHNAPRKLNFDHPKTSKDFIRAKKRKKANRNRSNYTNIRTSH